MARLLIEAVEAAVSAQGPLALRPWTEEHRHDHDVPYAYERLQPVFVVGVGPGAARYRVDFPQARAIGDLLWRRLCDALPGEGHWAPDPPAHRPSDL